MKKIRVLLVGHIGEPRGGVSTYYETLLQSSLKDKVHLYFIETSKGGLKAEKRGKWSFINWINALENVLHFLVALFSFKPDLVHIGTAYGASFLKHGFMVCLAKMAFFPVIIQPHCSVNKILPPNRRFMRKLGLFILGQCSGITILSREWEILSDCLPNMKICYMPNCINVKPYLQLPRPRQHTNGKVNILYIGYITKEKGIFDLVQAAGIICRRSTGFTVNIVGEVLINEELNAINEIIESNDLREKIKIFSPEYGKKQIDRFGSTDIFVLPSYHEGMPMSVLEAMAAGLPVVASNVGGIPDLIESEITGKLIHPGDVQALSYSLIDLIESPEMRLAWGEKARQLAICHFDVEARIPTLVSFYNKVVLHY